MKIKVIYTTTVATILNIPENKIQYFNNDPSWLDMHERDRFMIEAIPDASEIIDWEEIEE